MRERRNRLIWLSTLLVAALLLGIGYAGDFQINSVTRHTLRTESFCLTQADPTNTEVGIVLLGVDSNGATRIRVSSTQTTLSALPGQYFVSQEFGISGLGLMSSSATVQTAAFVRVVCSTDEQPAGARTNEDVEVKIH